MISYLAACRRYAESVRLAEAALAADPAAAADHRGPWRRFDAACSACRAAMGQGHNPPPESEWPHFRKAALGWLRTDLAAWRADLARRPAEAVEAMKNWRDDTDLGSVRKPARLAKLPSDERESWQAFWHDVEALEKDAEKIPAKTAVKQ